MNKITNEISVAVYSLPWFAARDEGCFGDEGLDVEFVSSRSVTDKPYGPGVDSGSGDPASVNPIGGHLIEEGRVAIYRG